MQECGLHGMQFGAIRDEPFDRGDRLALAPNGSVRQDTTRRPSMCTVRAPQAPRSQPFFVPVRPARSRSASSNDVRSSIVIGNGVPLTCSTTLTCSDCPVSGAPGMAAEVSSAWPWRGRIARPLTVPASNVRRVTLGSHMFPPPLFSGLTQLSQLAARNCPSG